MIKIGLTGEMCSGKSYCARIFEQLGVPIFYSDNVSKTIINTNQKLRIELCKEFGSIYDENGLIAKRLGKIVFAKGAEDKLKRLNKIVHPYVLEEYIKFCNLNSDKNYTLAESAILFESDSIKSSIDKIIYVCADIDTRLKRAFDRSGILEFEYHQRMKNQINSEIKKELSDIIIYSNEDDDVYKQVIEIHNKFK